MMAQKIWVWLAVSFLVVIVRSVRKKQVVIDLQEFALVILGAANVIFGAYTIVEILSSSNLTKQLGLDGCIPLIFGMLASFWLTFKEVEEDIKFLSNTTAKWVASSRDRKKLN